MEANDNDNEGEGTKKTADSKTMKKAMNSFLYCHKLPANHPIYNMTRQQDRFEFE